MQLYSSGEAAFLKMTDRVKCIIFRPCSIHMLFEHDCCFSVSNADILTSSSFLLVTRDDSSVCQDPNGSDA